MIPLPTKLTKYFAQKQIVDSTSF